MLSEQEVAAYLGRPLTPTESTNFDLYLDTAVDNLQELLCFTLEVQGGSGATPEERTYTAREGYSTVFTDIFTDVDGVERNETAVDDYTPMFFDNRNKGFYNSLVFDNRERTDDAEIAITATWGFVELPKDLARVLSQAFAVVSKRYVVSNVKRKDVEDFSVTYGDLTDDEAFMKNNAITIAKYSLCDVGYIKHGRTCNHERYCLRCF